MATSSCERGNPPSLHGLAGTRAIERSTDPPIQRFTDPPVRSCSGATASPREGESLHLDCVESGAGPQAKAKERQC